MASEETTIFSFRTTQEIADKIKAYAFYENKSIKDVIEHMVTAQVNGLNLPKRKKLDVKKGQIRQTDSGRCYLIFMVTDDTKCLIIDEIGAISIRLNSVVETWTIRNDISIDEFAERIFNNL